MIRKHQAIVASKRLILKGVLRGLHFIKKFKPTKKHRLQSLFSLFVFIALVASTAVFLTKPSNAAWFNDSWAFRKKITVSNSSGSALTNYRLSIAIGTLTSTQINSTCSDIRVTDVNSVPINMPYWVDCNDYLNPVIWINYTSLQTGTTILNIYYGNTSAVSTASNIHTVFTYGEDFSGTAIDTSNVTTGGGGAITQSDYLSAIGTNTWNTYAFASQTTVRAANRVIQGKFKGNSGNQAMFGFHDSGAGVSFSDLIYGLYFTNGTFQIYEDGSQRGTTYGSYTQGSWYDVKIVLKATGATYYQKLSTATSWTQVYDSNYSSETPGRVGFTEYTSANTAYTDSWVVWDEVATPPTYSVNTEEKAETPVLYWKMDDSSPAPINKLEQSTSISTLHYYNSSTSYTPSDNSLGLIKWDSTKYTSPTVYFEATIKINNNGGNCIGWTNYASLYDSSGNAVSGSEVSAAAGVDVWTIQRSGALTLVNGTYYTARVKSSIGSCYAHINSSRLVIVQNSTSGITNTRTSIEMGSIESQSSSTATQLSNKKIFYYDSTQYSAPPTTHLEVSLLSPSPTIEQQINIINTTYTSNSTSYVPADNSLGLIHWDSSKYPGATIYFEALVTDTTGGGCNGWNGYAALYTSAGSLVAGSIVGYPYTGYSLVRSGALSLTDNTDYTVRLASSHNSCTAGVKSARLVISQTNSTRITNTETQVEVGNYQSGFTNTAFAEITYPKVYQYTANKFSPTVESSGDATFSATLKINDAGDTVIAELYNRTNSTTVAQVTHTGDTNWYLANVSDIDSSANWDTSNSDDYVVRIRCNDDNGGGCSGNISNAKVILDQFSGSGITNLQTIQQQINANTTDSDSTYTSQSFQSWYNPDLQVAQHSFSGGQISYYFEATLKTSAGTGYAQLYNLTDGTGIASSEITTASTTYVRARSSNITASFPQFPQISTKYIDSQLKNSASNTTTATNSWIVIDVANLATSGMLAYADVYNVTDGSQVTNSEISSNFTSWSVSVSSNFTLTSGKEYVIRLRSSNNNASIYLQNATLILDQSASKGIMKTETIQPLVITTTTDTDSTYTSQYLFTTFTPSNFNNYAAYFESTLKATAGTGYSQLYNYTNSSAITGSEISTTSTSFVRRRSTNISANMPTTTKTMDSQIKNSASSGNTTTTSSTWIIIDTDNDNWTHNYQNNDSLNGYLKNTTLQSESTCINEKCLSLNGTSSYMYSPYVAQLDPGTSSFTVSIWFRHPSAISAQNTLISRYSNAGWKIYLNSSGNACFGIDDDSTWGPDDSACTTTAYSDNNWHQLAVIKTNTSSVDLYIDGIRSAQNSSLTASGSLSGSSPIMYLGVDSNYTSNFFAGSLDEFKYYNFAQTPTQIATYYSSVGLDHNMSSTQNSKTQLPINGLVGYWKMDESSWSGAANEVLDSSGNSNHGQATSGPTTGAGKFGSGGTFDGTDDYVLVADNSSQHMDNHGFSGFAWLKASNSGGNHKVIMTKGGSNAGTPGFWFSLTSTNKLDLTIGDGTALIIYNAISQGVAGGDGVWHHVGFTWDPNFGAIFYIDGNQSGTVTVTSTTSINNTATLKIGGYTASTYTTNGSIDEARLYNRTLTPTEIQQLYTWAPEPVAYWKLDENTGTTAYNTADTSFTGTWHGADTHWTTGKSGSAGLFNGIDNYIDTPQNTSVTKGLSQFTISAWVKPAEIKTGYIYWEARSMDGSGRIGFRTNATNNLFFSVRNPEANASSTTIATSNTALATNTWYYVTAIYDSVSDIHSIYINGVKDISNSVSVGAIENTNNPNADRSPRIGSQPLTDYFSGSIDDVKIYNYARTPAQIVQDMNAGHPAPGSPIGSAQIHYSFEEGHGGVVYNLGNLGSTYNGSLGGGSCPTSGCPSWNNSGISGASLSFINDANSEVEGDGASSVFNTPAFTYSAWIYRTGTTPSNGGGIFGRWETNEGAFLWVNPSDFIGFPVGTSPHLSSGVTANLNTWYHVVGTFDGTNSSIYINGVKKATQADSVTYAAITKTLEVGRYNTDDTTHFIGKIDEVKFYNFALTDDQVKTEFNQGMGQTMGSLSTTSSGLPDNSISGSFCVPGSTDTCTAPVAEWKFDESKNAYAYDSSGNNLTANITNPIWATGKIGSALKYNGTTVATITDPGGTWGFANGGLDAGTDNFTFSLWINPDASTAHSMTLLYKGAGSPGDPGYWLWWDYTNHRIAFDTSNNSIRDYYYTSTVNWDNKWHHLVVTLARTGSSDTGDIWLDGQKLSSQVKNDINGTSLDSTSHFYLGGNSANYEYVGLIDNFRVYNYVRSPSQIAWDFNRGAPVAQYDFDECSGTSLHDTAPKADRTITGYNGTITPNSGRSTGSCSSGVSTEMWNGGTNGKYSGSLAFDGSGDYVNIGNPVLNSTANFTISAWIYITGASNHSPIISELDQSTAGGYALKVPGIASSIPTCIRAYGSTNIYTATSSVVAPRNQWVHLSCTYQGSTNNDIRIYLNGKSVPVTITSGTYSTGTVGLVTNIGRYPVTGSLFTYFNGQIDDVRIYNYALTPTQVNTLYNNNSAVQF